MHGLVIGRPGRVDIDEPESVSAASSMAQADARELRLAAFIVGIQVYEEGPDALTAPLDLAGERGRRRLLEIRVQAEVLPGIVPKKLRHFEEARFGPDGGGDPIAYQREDEIRIPDREVRLSIGSRFGFRVPRQVVPIDLGAAHAAPTALDQPGALRCSGKAVDGADHRTLRNRARARCPNPRREIDFSSQRSPIRAGTARQELKFALRRQMAALRGLLKKVERQAHVARPKHAPAREPRQERRSLRPAAPGRFVDTADRLVMRYWNAFAAQQAFAELG